MRGRSIVFSLALVMGALLAWLWPAVPLEQRLVELQVARLWPKQADALQRESLALQAQLLDYAHDPLLSAKAHLALQRYPTMTRPILLLYGDRPAFQVVLREYGEHVIAPIHYFLSNDIRTVSLRKGSEDALRSVAAAWNRFWGAPGDDQGVAESHHAALTPADRGWFAVTFIEQDGHGFVGQFVVRADGEVSWIQTERVLEGIAGLFAGGLRGLEVKLRTDEAIGAADLGWAAVDLAIGASAVKVLRLGRAGAVAGPGSATFAQRSAALGASLLTGSRIGLRVAKYGAPVALAYIAVRHPSVLNALFGELAGAIGVPMRVVQTIGWMLVLLPILYLLGLLLGPIARLTVGCGRAMAWLGMRLSGRS